MPVRTMLWNGAITAGIYDRRNGVRTALGCFSRLNRVKTAKSEIFGSNKIVFRLTQDLVIFVRRRPEFHTAEPNETNLGQNSLELLRVGRLSSIRDSAGAIDGGVSCKMRSQHTVYLMRATFSESMGE